MPSIKFIVWERHDKLGVQAKIALAGTEVRVVGVEDLHGFREALRRTRNGVAILERLTVGEDLPDVIAAADLSDFRIIVVGTASADERRRDRDLGAHLLIDEPKDRRLWSGTLKRLAAVSQQELSTAAAAGRHRR
jgi:hypothetical protein